MGMTLEEEGGGAVAGGAGVGARGGEEGERGPAREEGGAPPAPLWLPPPSCMEGGGGRGPCSIASTALLFLLILIFPTFLETEIMVRSASVIGGLGRNCSCRMGTKVATACSVRDVDHTCAELLTPSRMTLEPSSLS
jgi:hypothetical protein